MKLNILELIQKYLWNRLKTNYCKELTSKIKYHKWEEVTYNFYYLSYNKLNFYKRKVSKNYWHFTVSDGIMSCSFKMYAKEE